MPKQIVMGFGFLKSIVEVMVVMVFILMEEMHLTLEMMSLVMVMISRQVDLQHMTKFLTHLRIIFV